MIGLVLDTNVVVSANLNAEGIESLVVSLALNGRIQLYPSEPILAEYERVVLYPRLKFNSKEVSKFLALVRRVASLVKPTCTVTESSDDADIASGMRRNSLRRFPGHRQQTALPETVEEDANC